jgi:hypothetical protein
VKLEAVAGTGEAHSIANREYRDQFSQLLELAALIGPY